MKKAAAVSFRPTIQYVIAENMKVDTTYHGNSAKVFDRKYTLVLYIPSLCSLMNTGNSAGNTNNAAERELKVRVVIQKNIAPLRFSAPVM